MTEQEQQDIVAGFRKAIEDLLVPEFKVVQAELQRNTEKMDAILARLDETARQLDARLGDIQRYL